LYLTTTLHNVKARDAVKMQSETYLYIVMVLNNLMQIGGRK
jgi:hypothetical protein